MRLFIFLFFAHAFLFSTLGCQSFRGPQRSISNYVAPKGRAVRGTALFPEVTSFEGLQQNGMAVSMRVEKCSKKDNATCLYYKPQGEKETSILIDEKTVHATEIGFMGFHFPGKYETVYLYVYMDSPFPQYPAFKSAVYVIDPNVGKKVGWADNYRISDYSLNNSYFSVAKGPEQKGYPFLGPGMHYLDVPYWNYLCFFDPKNMTNYDEKKCGPGFRVVSTSFRDRYWKSEAEAAKFRHNRGWLLDIDRDGWDDLHLPFFRFILSISGRTGQQLTLSLFDVAKASEPDVQEFFHHGRYYGGYTLIKDDKGEDLTLLTSGSTVGSFSNWNCSVSRYTAAIRWNRTFITGKPYATLAWSDYASFSNTAFTWDYSSVNSYFRKGDQINKCIHRFSDSLIERDGSPTMAYSQFEATDKYDCEQEAFEASKNLQDKEAQKKMQQCMEEGTKKTHGTWHIYVKNAVTGEKLNTMPRAYLWGRLHNFYPNEAILYLVENFNKGDGRVRFDKSNHVPENYSLVKVAADGSWIIVDTLENPGAVPRVDSLECLTSQSGSQSSSMDASCGRPEFITKDIDGDGLNEIQLEAKPNEKPKWIGYSRSLNRMVIK